ncbi:MAG: PQQ-binding-like beta-propeller repeat protein [Limisphaerales bacterium]
MTIAASCLVLAGVSRASGQDWPQWRGANRDAKAAGFTPPKTWPKELTQKWKITVGSGDATPALLGDRLYVFTRQEGDEVVSCLDASNGKEVWTDKYAVPAIGGPDAAVHGGPRSSPTVAEGKVVTLGVSGTVSCLDAASGAVKWRKNDYPEAWPRFHTATSPIVADGLCIVQLGKESQGAVVAYDLAKGDEKWKWTDEGPGYASPVLMTVDGTKMIVTLTAKSVAGLALADGKLLWHAPFVPQGMNYNAATPIVDGQTVFYCGAGRGTKAVKIEKQGDSFTATELWSNPENAVQFDSPILKSGLIFGLSQRGSFFCLDAKTGKTDWTDSTGGRGQFGSVVDAGSVLLGLTAKSTLIAFEPSDKGYTELASIKVANTQTYAYPVLAGNRLFIKDQNSLTLWTID